MIRLRRAMEIIAADKVLDACWLLFRRFLIAFECQCFVRYFRSSRANNLLTTVTSLAVVSIAIYKERSKVNAQIRTNVRTCLVSMYSVFCSCLCFWHMYGNHTCGAATVGSKYFELGEAASIL